MVSYHHGQCRVPMHPGGGGVVPLLLQEEDLEDFYRCIDFGHIPIIASTATEIVFWLYWCGLVRRFP